MVLVTGGNTIQNRNHQEDGVKNPTKRGTSRSWGTTASGQSVSTSGSVGSPSSRSELAMATPASDNTSLRLNHLDVHGDDARSQGSVGSKKKKRGQRAVGGDKSGRGLRQFSLKVCEKVESKGRTTYNEVADELVAEFGDPGSSQQYDEKNIRRRVYDALNVLMAMDIISKDKKEIEWKGLPHTSLSGIEDLKVRIQLHFSVSYVGLQNLIQRYEQLYSSGNAPSGGVAFPFILVQTRPHATVEVEISEDMQLVHFDFNRNTNERERRGSWGSGIGYIVRFIACLSFYLPSYWFSIYITPFELHDDNYVLKAMKFCERLESDETAHNFTADGEGSSMSAMYQQQILPPPRTSTGKPPTSPPLPGILKARVKHEH
ncbi:hypothetical protein V6N11_065282 [Hibiscus sabdariffa]|uniref:Uncharacterized protein n=1 Tax=Hibiscus sabdariffa TaxID=183260 RepID=A0ABR2QGG6_9ROSI